MQDIRNKPISTGSNDSADLIEPFSMWLAEINPYIHALWSMRWPARHKLTPRETDEAVSELIEYLEECAPPGYRFGLSGTSKTMYGFWEEE